MLNKQDEKIFIDLDDEITFVVERIREASADRIVLVAPEGASVISSLVSLKLLSKLVYKHGKSLVIVTLDEVAHKMATKAGIQVLKRVADINEGVWLESENKLRKRGIIPVVGADKKESAQEDLTLEGESNVDDNDNLPIGQDKKEEIQESFDPQDESETDFTVSEVGNTQKSDANINEMESLEEIPSFLKRNDNSGTANTMDPNASLEEFGFVVGKDIAQKESVFIGDNVEKEAENTEFISDFRKESTTSEDSGDLLNAVGRDMSSFELKENLGEKFQPKRVLGSIKKPKLRFPKLNSKSLIPLIVLILLFVGLGGVFAYFIAPEATIIAQVKYETLEYNQEIVASLDTVDVDLEGLQVPLLMQEVEESGSDSVSSTGNEVRGDKAKGKVTLVNKTENRLQLAKGTGLSGGGYRFLLASDEEIPATDFFGDLGRSEVEVEAYDIGPEYNISSGKDFTVEGYTTTALTGRNFESFSGGTKREVRVVTAEDRNSLKESLETTLKERVEIKVKAQIGEGFELNEEMVNIEVIEEVYDADVGSEASSVNLNMKVRARAYVYSMDDVNILGEQLLLSEIPSGLKLLEDKSEYSVEYIRREDDKAVLKLIALGVISGDITENSIKDSITGKSLDEIDSILDSLDSLTGYELILGPDWLPKQLRRVPMIKGRIQVSLEVDKEEADFEEVEELEED